MLELHIHQILNSLNFIQDSLNSLTSTNRERILERLISIERNQTRMALTVDQIRTTLLTATTEAHAAHELLHLIKAKLDAVEDLSQLQDVKDALDAEIAELSDEVAADTPPAAPVDTTATPTPAPGEVSGTGADTTTTTTTPTTPTPFEPGTGLDTGSGTSPEPTFQPIVPEPES